MVGGINRRDVLSAAVKTYVSFFRKIKTTATRTYGTKWAASPVEKRPSTGQRPSSPWRRWATYTHTHRLVVVNDENVPPLIVICAVPSRRNVPTNLSSVRVSIRPEVETTEKGPRERRRYIKRTRVVVVTQHFLGRRYRVGSFVYIQIFQYDPR